MWARTCLSLFVVAAILQPTKTQYAPVLSWDVCSPSRILVTLQGAVDGGIIYIKGYGSACRQYTTSTETQHEFDFDACGIQTAESYFTMIVQKNPLYQTGADLQESLLCIYDLSDISVTNSRDVGDKSDDAGVNKTVKPTAHMKLFKDGQDVSGSEVKLTDLVTMTIQLADEFVQDFDIKAKSCTANFINIVEDFCAADEELFPNFVHPTQGAITSTFGAFRTTELAGGYVTMVFSCTLLVCLGQCSAVSCPSGSDGWGRKRRAGYEDVAFEDMSVGASFSVGTEVDVTPSDPIPDDSLCIHLPTFIVCLVIMLMMLLTSVCVTVYVTNKLRKRSRELCHLRKVTEGYECLNTRERRRSSISIKQNGVYKISPTMKKSDYEHVSVTNTVDFNRSQQINGAKAIASTLTKQPAPVSALSNQTVFSRSQPTNGDTAIANQSRKQQTPVAALSNQAVFNRSQPTNGYTAIANQSTKQQTPVSALSNQEAVKQPNRSPSITNTARTSNNGITIVSKGNTAADKYPLLACDNAALGGLARGDNAARGGLARDDQTDFVARLQSEKLLNSLDESQRLQIELLLQQLIKQPYTVPGRYH